MKAFTLITLVILCLVAMQPVIAQNGNVQATAAASTTTTLSESDKISQLIESVRSMKGATFIRNGSEHSCQEAAEHLRAKWEKHNSKIKSAEDFILHLATKSSATGEVYKIRFPDGREEPTAEILHQALKQLK